jgi:hypothetical protein
MTVLFPPADATRLSLEAFYARADVLWSSLAERVVKVERRQSYQEPGNPSYEALLAGDWERAVALAAHTHDEDKQTYAELREKGVEFLRLRVVDPPLTDYLRWELEHYKVTSSLGEDVRVVRLSDVAELDARVGLSDFLLFDHTAAMIHDYGTDGLLRGGWLTNSSVPVREISEIVTALTARAMPLAAYLAQMGVEEDHTEAPDGR